LFLCVCECVCECVPCGVQHVCRAIAHSRRISFICAVAACVYVSGVYVFLCV